jgi:FKBP-type peptidyl-prolyl cis-trans isomerase FklB
MIKTAIIGTLIIFLFSTGCKKTDSVTEKNEESKVQTEAKGISKDHEIVSYRMGFDHASVVFKEMHGIDPEIVCQGIKDAHESPLTPKYDDVQYTKSLAKVRKTLVQDKAKQRLAESLKNRPKSEELLKENKSKEGVQVLENGLQLKVLKEGTGNPVTMEDVVEVHYQGWDVNGKLFDSSFIRKSPTKFDMNILVKGLQEGFMHMKKGGKYKLWVPPNLGYGDKGYKNRVEGGMALIFEIEVLNIQRNAAKDPAGINLKNKKRAVK